MPHRNNSEQHGCQTGELESLIESVRQFPCLYDTRQKEYKDNGIRENAWKLVVCEVQSINSNSSDTVLREGKCKYIFIHKLS